MNFDEKRKTAIENYIESYNNFDVENMLKDLDEKVVFKNIASGEITLTTHGITEFRQQAERAKTLFSQRKQTIIDLRFTGDEAEAAISYAGTLAADLSDELKAGDKIELNGKSFFRFAGDKIIEIEDVS